MARAGYCESCGTNVYLTDDGSCPWGHGREVIRDVYEVPDPAPMKIASDTEATTYAGSNTKKKSKTLLIIVIAVVLLGCCLAASLIAAIGMPVFSSAQATAEQRSCFANQRTIEGAAQVMRADIGTYPSTIADLVEGDYLMAVPECLGGGEYVYSASDATVSCTEHGHY